MRMQISSIFVLLLQTCSLVRACDFYHTEETASVSDAVYSEEIEDLAHDNLNDPHQPRSLNELHRRAAAEPRDWQYANSSKWADIKAGYATCKTGKQQSPIRLLESDGLAKTHKPTFVNYDRNVKGDLYNWGFGPSFTLYKDAGITTLPAMRYDDKTVYLIGFHLHFPAEHEIDGCKSKAELHLVHADAKGKPAAVVGILIDVGAESYSISTVPAVPGPYDTTIVKDVALNMSLDIKEAGYLKNYWTYEGSLTTPPCDEGLRWFVSKDVMTVSKAQLKALRRTNGGLFSARDIQERKEQHVNV